VAADEAQRQRAVARAHRIFRAAFAALRDARLHDADEARAIAAQVETPAEGHFLGRRRGRRGVAPQPVFRQPGCRAHRARSPGAGTGDQSRYESGSRVTEHSSLTEVSNGARRLLIHGEWVDGTAGELACVNPATGVEIHRVQAASAREVDAAVTSAAHAARE